MLYEPSSPTAIRQAGLAANPPPLTPYRGATALHRAVSGGTSNGGAVPGATSPQATAVAAVAAPAVGGSAAVTGPGRHHHPAPPLWDQALELEKRLRMELRKKSFWDPDVRRLRASLQGTYEALLFGHYEFACAHEVEPNSWKAVFYKPIEEFRSRIRALESLVRGATTPTTLAVSPTGGAGGGVSPPAAVQLATPEEARAQLGRTTSAYMRFLDEALAFYRKLVWKLQWVHGTVGAVVDLDAALQMEIQDCVPRAQGPRAPEARQSVHRCLIYLGDLCRYQSMALKDRPASARPLWERAMSYYRQGARVLPASGNPYNQMAVMSYYTNDELRAVYYYFRSLAVSMPFVTARENLLLLFEKNRNRYGSIAASHAAAALQGGHEADVRAAASHIADVSVRFVRLHGMLFDKINLHQFPEVLAAAMHDLEAMLDHPGCRTILQKAPEADQLLFHLAIMNIFSVHNANAVAGGDGSGGGSYAAAVKRAELLCHALTVAMRFTAVVTAAAASMASSAAAGGGVGDVETGFGAVSTACHVMLAWIVSNPEVLSPKPTSITAGSTSSFGSGSGKTEMPPEVAAEVTARCAFLTAAARLAAHLSDLTRRRAHDQDWQDPAVRHRSLPEDSELVGFGPLVPVVSVAAAWPAPSDAPGEVAVFAVRVARMLQALRHLDDALGPGLLWPTAAAGPAACSPPTSHSQNASASPWHTPAASVAMPQAGSALAQELSRAVRGFRNAVVRATAGHMSPPTNLPGSCNGGTMNPAGGIQNCVHPGLAHGNGPVSQANSAGSGGGGDYIGDQDQPVSVPVHRQQQQRLTAGQYHQPLPNGCMDPHALVEPAHAPLQPRPSGSPQPPPPPPMPRTLMAGAISNASPTWLPSTVPGSRPTYPEPALLNSNGNSPDVASAVRNGGSGGGNGNGKADAGDDVVEDEIVYQPPRLPRPTSMSNGLHVLHRKSNSSGGFNGLAQLQDGRGALSKQLSGSSAAPTSLLASREPSREGSALLLCSPSALSTGEMHTAAGTMIGGSSAAMLPPPQGLVLNIAHVGGVHGSGGGGRASSSGMNSPGSAQGGTMPPSPRQKPLQQYPRLTLHALPQLHASVQQQQQNAGHGDASVPMGSGVGGPGTGMAPVTTAAPTALAALAASGRGSDLPPAPLVEERLCAGILGVQQNLLPGGGTGNPNALLSALQRGGRRVSAGAGDRPGSSGGNVVRRPPSAGTTRGSGGGAAPRPASAAPGPLVELGAAPLSQPHSPQVLHLEHAPQLQQHLLPQGQDVVLPPAMAVATISTPFIGLPASLQQRVPQQHQHQEHLHNQAGVPGLQLLTGGNQPQRPSAAAAVAGLGLGQGPGPVQGLKGPLALPAGAFAHANGAMHFSSGISSANSGSAAAAFAGLPVALAAPRLAGGPVAHDAAASRGVVTSNPTAQGQMGWPAGSITAGMGVGGGLPVPSYFEVATDNYQAAAIAEATAEATAVAMADELLQAMDEDEGGASGKGGSGSNGFTMFGIGGGSSSLYGGGGDDFLDMERFSPAAAAAAAVGALGGAVPVTREHSAGSEALFIAGLSGGSASAGAAMANGMLACRSSGSGSGVGFAIAAPASVVAAAAAARFRASGDGTGVAVTTVTGAGLEGFGSWGVTPVALPESLGDYHQVLRRSGGTDTTATNIPRPSLPLAHRQQTQWHVQQTAGAVTAVGNGDGAGNGGLFGEDLSCLSYLAAQLQQQRPDDQGQRQGERHTWQGQAQAYHLQGPAGAQG